jgi:hypothetical protein
MTTPSPSLHLLDERLKTQIENCQSAGLLRRFACACAQYSLTVCALTNDSLIEALALAQALSTSQTARLEVERLYQAVSQVVKRLDDVAFDMQDTMQNSQAVQGDYYYAFRQARAATSVLACLQSSAAWAAADACYEAYHATQDADELFKISERILTHKSG